MSSLVRRGEHFVYLNDGKTHVKHFCLCIEFHHAVCVFADLEQAYEENMLRLCLCMFVRMLVSMFGVIMLLLQIDSWYVREINAN